MDEKDFNREAQALELLKQWQAGNRAALAALTPTVHRELNRLARRYFRREQFRYALPTIARIHEAFMQPRVSRRLLEGHAHFYLGTARLMRYVLLERSKARESDSNEAQKKSDLDMVKVDRAFTKLEKSSSVAAHVLELHYFSGMSIQETAIVLGLSVSTAGREIRCARAWLIREICLNEESCAGE